jgi:glycosyltransferase involved in cell wall biosynthesis
VFAQNHEIARILVARRLAYAEQVRVVAGSGVDLQRFAATPVMRHGGPRFLYLGRLLRDKGLVELQAAALALRREIPAARVWVAGAHDPNPTAISSADLRRWQDEGGIELLSFQADVRPLLRECTAFVLPSYHEGMPRAVLEAMAMARAVITTDTIGCRETIADVDTAPLGPAGARLGRNGVLVPVRSADALTEAMLHLARNTDLAASMGEAGRRIAERQFDVRTVNADLLTGMGLAAPIAERSTLPAS